MKRLLYCLPSALSRQAPGMNLFAEAFTLYGWWVIPIDRSDTIKIPVRLVNMFPLPKFVKFAKSYEEICNDRATDVLRKMERLGVDLHILYSGGIDSTCMLVSLLKNATAEQKKHLVVLLSHESIAENPRFYDEHIRGRLRVESSIIYSKYIGTRNIFISAEHNDMVLGNDKIGAIMNTYGPRSIHEPYNRDMMLDFFAHILFGNFEAANFYIDLFERIVRSAPIPITSNLEFLWWINFCIKWQACFAYVIMHTSRKNVQNVTREYMNERFLSFYNTEDFQLWSMNNPHMRIKDTWKSYKWVAKDIIYGFNKDAEYRDHKTKKASLPFVSKQQNPFKFLDENMNFTDTMDVREYYDPVNDFA
jgi:hypothetical protein